MYADFDFYRYEYKGNRIKDEDTFEFYGRKASAYINKISFGRINEADENVKNAVCSVVDRLALYGKRQGISAEENDGYRVTYEKEDTSQLFKAAALFLPVRLLYRGV